VVAGFVVKNPVTLVDDLLGVLQTVSPDLQKNLDKLQSDHGLNIRNDIAAPLGGEFAFAIDGPILPTPSWKLVFEVNDPTHLQQTLERPLGPGGDDDLRAVPRETFCHCRAQSGGRTGNQYDVIAEPVGTKLAVVHLDDFLSNLC